MGDKRANRFYTLIDFELYKITHHRWIILSIATPVIIAIVVFVYFWVSDYPHQINTGGGYSNPYIHISNLLFSIYRITFPTIIAIICSQYFMIEQQAESGRSDRTIPYSNHKSIALKYVTLLSIITIMVISVYFVFLIGSKLSGVFLSTNIFAQYDMRAEIFVAFSKLLMLSYCITSIQYGLSRLSNSYIIPLIIPLIAVQIDTDIDWLNIYFSYGYMLNIKNDIYLWKTSYSLSDALIFVLPTTIIAVNITYGKIYLYYKTKKCKIK